jgi:hypothetical protein
MAGLPMILTGRSNKPGSSDVVLVNGDSPDTGYRLLQPNLGGIDWNKFYSGVRGTQGARLVGAEPQNRQVLLNLEVVGTSQDNLHQRLDTLWDLDAEWRRFGGTLTWRPRNGSFKLYFDVLDSAARIGDYDRNLHMLDRVKVDLAPVCGPYVKGDPFDIYDPFTIDTSADYTVDAAGGGFSIKGGQLVPTATGTAIWRHSGRGYTYGDTEATLACTTGSVVTNYEAGVYVNADTTGAQTYLSAEILAAAAQIRVVKRSNGSPTTLASNAFTVNASTSHWLRIRHEGRLATAEVFTTAPTPLATPAATATYTLDYSENQNFRTGQSGFRLVVVSTGERYDDFTVEPYTYVSGSSFGN